VSIYEPLRFDGMREFQQALRDLPGQLKAEMEPIIDETLDGCTEDIQSQYTEGETGNLRKGVKVRKDSALSGRVQATAPHTHLYEFGTVKRYLKSGGAARGQMPAANPPVFIPTAMKWRERMLRRGEELLRTSRPAIGDGSMV
jgi:hypothetical protein